MTALALAAALACAAEPIEPRLAAVVDLLHDLSFEDARKAAEAVERDFPGHPAGPFFRGMVDYQLFLVEDPPSRRTWESFELHNGRAVRAAEAWSESGRAVAEQFLGAAHGFRARALLAQRRLPPAVLAARRAVKHLKRAVELDPSLEDAYLGLGMYHYFLARMAAPARPLALLMIGMRGDRELGLAHIRRAAERGLVARHEARAILAVIYGSRWERRWREADRLLADLMARFPRNPRFRFRRAFVALSERDFDRAAALVDPGRGWIDGLDPRIRARARKEALVKLEEISDLRAGRRSKPARVRWPLPSTPD